MKLTDYLNAERMTQADFAAKIGVSQAAVNFLCHGSVPNPKTAGKIAEVTGGLVMPNDFYDIEPVVKRRDAPRKPKPKRDNLALLDDDKGFAG